jgi:hypothetical protein
VPILRTDVPPKTDATHHKTTPISATTKIAGAKAVI